MTIEVPKEIEQEFIFFLEYGFSQMEGDILQGSVLTEKEKACMAFVWKLIEKNTQ